MNTTDLLAIALRLFALFLLYSAFVMGIQHYQYIHQAAHTGASDDIGALLVLGIIQVGGLLLAAVILLKFPLTLARRLAPAPAAEANSDISAASSAGSSSRTVGPASSGLARWGSSSATGADGGGADRSSWRKDRSMPDSASAATGTCTVCVCPA